MSAKRKDKIPKSSKTPSPGGKRNPSKRPAKTVDPPAALPSKMGAGKADVTALHAAETARQQSERRFRALTEKASDYITVVDAAGAIVYENPTAHRTLGYAAGDLVGRDGFEFIHPDDLPRARCLFADLMRRPGSFAEAEIRSRAREGSWRWLHVLATNLLDDPAVRGIVLNSRDVTEQKQALEELRRLNDALDQRVRERTESIELLQEQLLSIADQMQQQLAQDLHDDLGQELTGLTMKAATLAEALEPGGFQCAPSNGGGVAAPALCTLPRDLRNRCGTLAADILAATKRTQAKVRDLAHRILPIELELNSLSGALRQLADSAGPGSSVVCTFRTSHPEETFEGRQAGHLYRIAQEAVANAIRHARPRNICIELAKDGGQTLLAVSDDGRGMPADVAAGGVGLRIMKYRAGLIGATLEISPGRGGRGTTIACRLPADDGSTSQSTRSRRQKTCPPKS